MHPQKNFHLFPAQAYLFFSLYSSNNTFLLGTYDTSLFLPLFQFFFLPQHLWHPFFYALIFNLFFYKNTLGLQASEGALLCAAFFYIGKFPQQSPKLRTYHNLKPLCSLRTLKQGQGYQNQAQGFIQTNHYYFWLNKGARDKFITGWLFGKE